MRIVDMKTGREASLNESPSEKEGKCEFLPGARVRNDASMKVPPKRKGNLRRPRQVPEILMASMKVPPKRKGSFYASMQCGVLIGASMKVPPKRKGNRRRG